MINVFVCEKHKTKQSDEKDIDKDCQHIRCNNDAEYNKEIRQFSNKAKQYNI